MAFLAFVMFSAFVCESSSILNSFIVSKNLFFSDLVIEFFSEEYNAQISFFFLVKIARFLESLN